MSLPYEMQTMPKLPGNTVLDNRSEDHDLQTDEYGMKVTRYVWWNPRVWSKRVWLGVTLLAIGAILGAALGGVQAEKTKKANRYPDYCKLDYSLVDMYSGENFFDKFDYFTGYDPAGGLVHYVDAEGSAALNLTYATKSSAILQVDTTDKNATTGRRSARITSKTTYNHGLFIFSILRTPFGCAIWPALWLTDPSNWPAHGEIDIIEATNNGTEGNAVTLHTTAGCTMEGVKRKGSKYPVGLNCAGGSGSDFDGCSTGNGDYSAYGPSLNSGGGGVYAMEWRTAGIRVCFWPMSDLAPDIEAVVKSNGTTTTKPDPSTWSTPQADFPNTKCDIDAHFSNQSIIANIDFCGEAQAVFKEPGQCAGTCEQAVATGNFSNAVWEWGGWWVYQSA